MAAALLPQLRMRPGSRSCDLDGMAWHKPAVPGGVEDRQLCLRGFAPPQWLLKTSFRREIARKLY